MAQIFCPECGREINDHANQCPYCKMSMENIKFELSKFPGASKYQAENQEKRKSHYFLWFIVVISCVITFVCLLKTCTSSNKHSYGGSYGGSFSSFNTSADAKVCAEDAVKQVLKSPSTAKFCPSYEMTAVNMGGYKWKVTGYVDAQNTFGTFIRSNWTVTLELTEEGYKHGKVTFDD